MQIIYFLPSFLSVLSVEYPPSGWWNCQSYRDWDDFFPYIARIVSIRKNKTPAKCSCHAKNILKINSKQLLFWTQLTDSLKLMFGRRYQEIWKKNVWRFVSLFENIPHLFSLLVASDQNLWQEPWQVQNVTWLNYHTLGRPSQYFFIIPSSLISLSHSNGSWLWS